MTWRTSGPSSTGAPDLEFRMATEALELEKSGPELPARPARLSLSVWATTHKKQEEVYVVLRGERPDEGRRRNRRAQGMGRGARPRPVRGEATRPGPEGLEILVIGAPNLGESPREERSMASATGWAD